MEVDATGYGTLLIAICMAKKIFLHIGHYKTGTSAIQNFLSDNVARLRKRGFLYPTGLRPRNNPTNHGILSLSLAQEYGFHGPGWYSEKISADEAYAALHAELNEAREENIILSSEEYVQLALCSDPNAAVADLKKHLAPYPVTVVFYIREPMALLKSWFNERNKGPMATRTFPILFMKLSRDFLGQQAIRAVFARHFGEENIKTLTYKHIGEEHIAEFLQATGCNMPVSKGAGKLVQQAIPEELLETSRLAKERAGTLDDYTISRINIQNLIRKVGEINAEYDQVAKLSDDARPSRLSSEAIIEYYARLLHPLQPTGSLNQKEANNLRDLALRIENSDQALALALMRTAQMIRPNGEFINKKIAEYTSGKERVGVKPF